MQRPLAVGKASWQGEPVAAVVAESRAIAEDGVSRVRVEWEPLPVVTDPETALDPSTPVIHPELGDNLAFKLELNSGDADAAFKSADAVLTETFTMGRHTGVTLEARAILADFDPSERRLTVYHSFQAPNMMQDILARHLGLPEQDVRVICKDVGGSFGIKVHIYPDEMATCALAVMLGRPVKFTADRLESFVSDIHAREHRVKAELAVKRDGTILGCAWTTSPASAPTPSTRARAPSRATRRFASRPGSTASATMPRGSAWSSRTRRPCASTAPSATRSPSR